MTDTDPCPASQWMGVHLLADFFACPRHLLTRREQVATLVAEVVKEADLSALEQEFHQFEPAGVSGFVLLAESHLSVHTWPENHSMAADIFCCILGPDGEQQARSKAERAFAALAKRFRPREIRKQVILR